MKTGIVSIIMAIGLLGSSAQLMAQSMDPQAVWPLCGRITEDKPKGWRPSKGCPSVRFGNPAYSDAPFSSTFGPRPLGSENDRYDFHRGVDIATPTGTPIFAISDGNVEISGVNSGYSDPLLKVRHYRPGFNTCTSGDGCYHSYYLHISDWVVSVDETVSKGQLIGYTGASGASGFQHLHFEVRDAPAFDVFSAWSRDAVHPFGALPYDVPNNTSVVFGAVDDANPATVTANVHVTSNRYDFVSVEMTVLDDQQQEVPQAGNTPNAEGYHLLPPFFDMEAWNFEYSHKDSSNYPWEEYGAGGAFECPYYLEHGASYSAHTHMDAQHPGSTFEGLFNGVHVITGKYWLNGNRDYWVDLEFQALQGPAACIEATAVFASGDMTTSQWGVCGGTPNQPPVAQFGYSCDALSCSFDATGSNDPDGSVDSFSWEFGDGFSSSGSSPGHDFAASGTYTVTLTVTDNEGAEDSIQHLVTVDEPVASDIFATVSTNKKGNRVAVSWTGAVSNNVDIYRNGVLHTNTSNDDAFNDRQVSGGNTYSYQVCEAGSLTECSPPAEISL
jgi:murein DD-endopeptidase MepM/ murein hydrolase activator NlpD/PKD repeat protein